MAKYLPEEIHKVKDSCLAHGCWDFSRSWRNGSRIAHLQLLTIWVLYHHQRDIDGKQGLASPVEVHPQRPAYASQGPQLPKHLQQLRTKNSNMLLCVEYFTSKSSLVNVSFIFSLNVILLMLLPFLFCMFYLVYTGCRFLTSKTSQFHKQRVPFHWFVAWQAKEISNGWALSVILNSIKKTYLVKNIGSH